MDVAWRHLILIHIEARDVLDDVKIERAAWRRGNHPDPDAFLGPSASLFTGPSSLSFDAGFPSDP